MNDEMTSLRFDDEMTWPAVMARSAVIAGTSRGHAPQARHAAGFTLVEVLVALAITAIALIAGMQASSALTRNADRQGQVLLAQICAENELIRTKLAGALPGVGDSSTGCEQGGARLEVVRSVQPTPNPNFRRVDASVSQDGVPVLQVSTIVGRW